MLPMLVWMRLQQDIGPAEAGRPDLGESPGHGIRRRWSCHRTDNTCGRFQGQSATGLILPDQCFWKSKAPIGRKSSAGAFQPSDLGLALNLAAMSSS